jgi:hypothetical protein
MGEGETVKRETSLERYIGLGGIQCKENAKRICEVGLNIIDSI